MRPEREQKLSKALSNRLESVTVVLEALHLRHNLNAVLRSAEAFGLFDVHLISRGRPIESGVARGAERWVQLHGHKETKKCLEALIERGFSIWVADLQPNALAPHELPVDKPVAIVMGTELAGVSDEAKKLADGAVMIPMRGLTQSLNVSVAAAIILQNVAERRRFYIGGGDVPQARQNETLSRWKARDEKISDSRRNRLLRSQN